MQPARDGGRVDVLTRDRHIVGVDDRRFVGRIERECTLQAGVETHDKGHGHRRGTGSGMTVLTKKEAVIEMIEAAMSAQVEGRHACAITLASAAKAPCPKRKNSRVLH